MVDKKDVFRNFKIWHHKPMRQKINSVWLVLFQLVAQYFSLRTNLPKNQRDTFISE
jgi:hypothetical protein